MYICMYFQIFNLLKIIFQLFDKLKNKDNNLTLTYQLGKTIRNKILNYKETVNSIYGDEDISFCLNTDQCVTVLILPSVILIINT